MSKIMNKLFDMILNRPWPVLFTLIAVTLICIAGTFLLEFDNSYETGMPRGDAEYLIGEQTKKLFKDTETYLLISIEPAKNRKVLSRDLFFHVNRMINEINEFKIFDQEKEDTRLDAILKKANVTVIPSVDLPGKKNIDEKYPQPWRSRNRYNYSGYIPLSITELRSVLDPAACDTLDTILMSIKIESGTSDEKIPLKSFKKILELWEDIYLFKSVEIVESFSNPIQISDIQGKNDTLRTVNLVETDENGHRILPSTEEDFARYKIKLQANPLFKDNYYSIDDSGEIRALAASLMLRPRKDYEQFMDYLWILVQKYDHDPVHLYIQGGLVFDKFINDYNRNDLKKFIPLVLLVVIFTFYLNFRTIRGTMLPTLTVVIATAITMGIMGFLGIRLTMVSTLLPPLIIVTGSSYSIRIFNQHLLDLEETHLKGKLYGLRKTLINSFPTVLLAGLTTFIGFLTMVVNKIPALRDLGIYAALGTAFSVAVSVALIISVLYLMELLPYKIEKQGGIKREPNRVVNYIVAFCSRITLRYHGVIVVFTLISIMVSIIGITRITTETSATSFFNKGSYLRRSLDRTNELFKGTYIINVVFSPGEGKSILDHDFLQYIEDVRLWLNRPGQDTEYSILYNSGVGDFIKRLNMAMNNDDPAFYSIPDTMNILDYMELFSGDDKNSDGRPDMFESTISPGYDRTNLMVRIGALGGEVMTTKKSQVTIEHIKKYLDEKANPKGYSYLITGGPTNFIIVSQYIVKGQIQAILLGILIIGFFMFLLYRNISASIVSLIPISCTVLWVFGIMGFSGMPLGMAQTLISSIAIGVGIDDTIQFIIILRRNLSSGMDFKTAVRTTHLEAGLAMVYTSIALLFGFSVLIFSNFAPIKESGLLVSGVMFFSTTANLILLPSVILTFRLQIHHVKKWGIFNKLKIHYLLCEKETNHP